MKKYALKMDSVEAVKFNGDNVNELSALPGVTEVEPDDEGVMISSESEDRYVFPGEWVVIFLGGEIFVYDDEAFRDMYREVDE